MPRQFDHDLNGLKDRLLTMGALAEQMVHATTTTLVEWDMSLFEPVAEMENKVDQMQKDIDEETVRVISVYTPVASDLRFLLMVTRMTTAIERIGDQAMNIGFYAKTMLKHPPLKPLIDLPRMADMAAKMLGEALDAFTHASPEAAVAVIKKDDRVDDLNDQLFRELITYVMGDPAVMTQVLELVLISRAYERIADHAVSIAKDVVYIVQGKDIRHATGTDDLTEGSTAREGTSRDSDKQP